jgi:hypothetical protein
VLVLRNYTTRRDAAHRPPILAALPVAHSQFSALEIQILYPQPQSFHQSQPTAVQHFAHQRFHAARAWFWVEALT